MGRLARCAPSVLSPGSYPGSQSEPQTRHYGFVGGDHSAGARLGSSNERLRIALNAPATVLGTSAKALGAAALGASLPVGVTMLAQSRRRPQQMSEDGATSEMLVPSVSHSVIGPRL